MLTLDLEGYAARLQFSSDGRYLAVGSWWTNPVVSIWKAPTYEEITALEAAELARNHGQ